jgi:hypothetical protein
MAAAAHLFAHLFAQLVGGRCLRDHRTPCIDKYRYESRHASKVVNMCQAFGYAGCRARYVRPPDVAIAQRLLLVVGEVIKPDEAFALAAGFKRCLTRRGFG